MYKMRRHIVLAFLLLLLTLLVLFIAPAAGQSEKPSFNWRSASLSLPPGALFTRNSPGSRINPTGEIKVMPPGAPRFDFDPVTHELRGMLFEERRVRLNKIAAAPTAAESVSVAATAYTISFYGTGIVTMAGAYEKAVTGTGGYPKRTVFTFTPAAAGTLILTPSGVVQHLQLEAGKSATSAIVGSEGNQLAREADVLKLPIKAFRYNATKGTLYIEYVRSVSADASSSLCGASLNDGTVNNYISLCNDSGGSSDQGIVQVNSAKTFVGNIGKSSIHPVKKAITWSYNNVKFAKDGVVVDSGAIETGIPSFKYLNIGSLEGTESLNGHVKAVQYYKNPLPSDDLRVITANIKYVTTNPAVAALPAILMLLLLSDTNTTPDAASGDPFIPPTFPGF